METLLLLGVDAMQVDELEWVVIELLPLVPVYDVVEVELIECYMVLA